MNIQFLALLSTIVAIVSSLLTISEKASNFKPLALIKSLSICFLPILFVQQILLITDQYKVAFLICLILGVIFLAITPMFHNITLDCDENLILIFTFLSIITFLCQPLFIDNLYHDYNSLMKKFITDLSWYKISPEMFKYLSQHIALTLSAISDTVNIVLLTIIEINFPDQCHYSILKGDCDIGRRKGIDTTTRIAPAKHQICVLLSLFLFSSGIIKSIIHDVVNLF